MISDLLRCQSVLMQGFSYHTFSCSCNTLDCFCGNVSTSAAQGRYLREIQKWKSHTINSFDNWKWIVILWPFLGYCIHTILMLLGGVLQTQHLSLLLSIYNPQLYVTRRWMSLFQTSLSSLQIQWSHRYWSHLPSVELMTMQTVHYNTLNIWYW